MTKPSREDIFRLAMRDPILHHAMMYWERGDCTFEEALMAAIVTLEEANRKRGEMIQKYMSMYGILPEE